MIPEDLKPALIDLLLAVADDKLLLGHRNSDWTGLGPMLEEDIAFSSIAQDEMAHALALFELVGELTGQSADELAFGRAPADYRCAAIVEISDDEDWAVAIARQFFCDHFDHLRLTRLARSGHPPLAALAGRLAAEERVHVEHADGWIRRLGQGTDLSKERMQAALDRLAASAAMLFEAVDGESALMTAGLYPPGDEDMFTTWTDALMRMTDDADLSLRLAPPDPETRGGRRGVHTPELTTLLDEMCEVYRIEPRAAW